MLCIELADRPSTDSREIAEGVVLDCDQVGRLVGIGIDHARHKTDRKRLALTKRPAEIERPAV